MLTILTSCRNLAARDAFGENDVFARGVVNGAKRLTPVVYNKNSPVWDSSFDRDNRCQRLEWELGVVPNGITLEAWDKDALTNDDLIGTACVGIDVEEIEKCMADARETAQPVKSQLHDLLSPEGKHCGQIEVSFEWQSTHQNDKSAGQNSSVYRLKRNTKAMKRAVRALIAQQRMDATKWMSGDGDGGPGFQIFCTALSLSAVSVINMSAIQMGPQGAKRLAACIPSSCTELDVSRNPLKADGKGAIGDAIEGSPMRTLRIDLGRMNTRVVLSRRETKPKLGRGASRFNMLKLAAVAEETGGGENVLVFTGADLQAEDVNMLGCWTAKKGPLEPKVAHVIKLSGNHDIFGEATHRDHHAQARRPREGGDRAKGADPNVVFASARKTMRKLQLIRGLGVEKIDLRDTFELSPPPDDAYRAWVHFCKQLESTSVSRLEMASMKMRLVAWQVLLDSLGDLAQLATLVLNENPICGPKRAPDMHISTWSKFCQFVRGSNLTSLAVERVGMGPKGANTLLKAVRSKVDLLYRPRRQVRVFLSFYAFFKSFYAVFLLFYAVFALKMIDLQRSCRVTGTRRRKRRWISTSRK